MKVKVHEGIIINFQREWGSGLHLGERGVYMVLLPAVAFNFTQTGQGTRRDGTKLSLKQRAEAQRGGKRKRPAVLICIPSS